MKKIVLWFLFVITSFSYSALVVEIVEPIRFAKDTKGRLNTTATADEVVGTGKIKIKSDCASVEKYKQEDKGKKIKVKFSKKGVLTNGKNWITIDSFDVATANQSFTLDNIDEDSKNEFYTKQGKEIEITAKIKRSELDFKKQEANEGVYQGIVFMVVEEYGKPLNRK